MTDVIMSRRWTGPNQKCQTIIRLAVYGFKDKMYENNYFQNQIDTCMCSLCKKPCGRYHVTVCGYRTKSITNYNEQ